LENQEEFNSSEILKSKMDKKGATLNTLYIAALTIIIVGILLGVGLYTMSEVSRGVASDTLTVVNETPVVFGTAAVSVATASDCQARDFAITSVWNGSEAEIPSTNYTFSTAGVLTGVADSPFNNSQANVSYTYTGTERTATTDPCETISTSVTGLSGMADWMTIIVVALAAGIVLAIVIGSFSRRRRSAV
jgi:hypothetical protein